MNKKTKIFVDMDGVIVDFDGYVEKNNVKPQSLKSVKGAYLNMSPMPGAFGALDKLIELGYDVWLATKPPTGIAHAYSDKAQWVFNHRPDLKRKLIVTPDKSLLGSKSDFLIDDRPHKANCKNFPGNFIEFNKDTNNWTHILEFFNKREQKYLVRKLESIKPRAETGPMQFGDDWTGIFIRGDNANAFAATLRQSAREIESPIPKLYVESVIELLESCKEN